MPTQRRRQEYDEDNNPGLRRNDRWHIAKDVPLALILAVGLQTAGGIWWMAQLSSKIDTAIGNISEFKSERYTREDARRDRELLEAKFKTGEMSDHDLERRIGLLEGRIDRLDLARRDTLVERK